ncbi:MAG: RagB/SusD family nutrient uptake outer membrane protein [Bacteroidetes bacterium]|nr:RagB/SusD family nutrient uptake outer membrane protein [Bacteroidota bacterium]
MKKYIKIFFMVIIPFMWSCNDKNYMDVKPTNILTTDIVFSDANVVKSVLADLYDRMPNYVYIDNAADFANYNEAMVSNGDYWRQNFVNYSYDNANLNWYDTYNYIRDINLFRERLQATTQLSADVKASYMGEIRFLLANSYFELVKRYGGVPLITSSKNYSSGTAVGTLQIPRAKESAVYDFIIAQMDTAKTQLSNDPNNKTRATKGAALALQARAAIYAASITKYNKLNTPTVTALPDNGEVGMSGADATKYYQKALAAAKEIIADGKYSLYTKKNPNYEDNFANAFLDKTSSEVILARDYILKYKTEGWTNWNQPRSQSEDNGDGGELCPSLNLVYSYEKLDNTFTKLPIASAGVPINYTNPTDLFAGRDGRLGGTVLLPGTTFKGSMVDIWAGLGSSSHQFLTSGDDPANPFKQYPGTDFVQVIGKDGPKDNYEHAAVSGFLVRKYLDPTTHSGQRGVRSDVWWIRYRYAEVLLIAAEASYELGDATAAAGYMNTVRARAGFQIPLTASDITLGRIVHENKVEFAFEDHLYWDLRRWRIAHKVFDGSNISVTDLKPAQYDAPDDKVFGLWPYKIFNPGGADNGQFYFVEHSSPNLGTGHNFQLGNYYCKIGDDIIARNPKLTKNPNQ